MFEYFFLNFDIRIKWSDKLRRYTGFIPSRIGLNLSGLIEASASFWSDLKEQEWVSEWVKIALALLQEWIRSKNWYTSMRFNEYNELLLGCFSAAVNLFTSGLRNLHQSAQASALRCADRLQHPATLGLPSVDSQVMFFCRLDFRHFRHFRHVHICPCFLMALLKNMYSWL